MTRILLVDDQRSLRRSLSLMLQSTGFETAEAANGMEALAILEGQPYDLVITDLRMDEMSGIDLLREIKARDDRMPVIVITAHGSIESAVDAMRLGAFDYLTKPFSEQEILEKIQASQALKHLQENVLPAENGPETDVSESIVADTPQMRAILIKIDRLALTDISVLITGETGTGKTMIARLIHEKSNRRNHAFVSINCASLPEQLLESELFGHMRGSFTGAVESRAGLFEEADKGTIFLDEIDTLSPAMQAKLLSVLQERQIRRVGSNKSKNVDIRVISASNQDIAALMQKGTFRSDLYFRVNGVRLHLLPLRERSEDLRLLLNKFVNVYGRKYSRARLKITPQAMAFIMAYPYPGNVRQLESFVEQMVVFADEKGVIDVEALPDDLLHYRSMQNQTSLTSQKTEVTSIAETERMAIETALQRFPHISDAARELGIGRTTLWRKMREYGIGREYVGSKKEKLS